MFTTDLFRNDSKAKANTLLAEVRAYWEALRDNGRLPLRAAIDPRGLASALEQVFLIERIAPGHARFRLAGHHLHDLMGMDVRGMPLSVLFEAGARQRVQPVVEEVFENATALHLGLEAERGMGRPAMAAKLMLLPLRAVQDEPAMALGVLVSQGSIGRAPRRFQIASLRVETLFETEVVARISRRNLPTDPVPVTSPGKPNLRLVHSREA